MIITVVDLLISVQLKTSHLFAEKIKKYATMCENAKLLEIISVCDEHDCLFLD